ncbi:MAG: glycosyltransferase [Candidatus Moranbacteria bacterium]|nr:glycosyltransferase [Candidatus Moranbacteria bacterium]
MENQPLVSIIITTKNEEKNIGACLESVKKQSYPQDKLEIIVVDNGSADRTKEIAGKHTGKVFDKGPERSAQRNFGVAKSQGDYVIYLDADMIMSDGVIADCIEKISQNDKIIALHISEIVMGERFFSQVRRFERSFYDGTVIDGVRFIKKSAFLEVGGFDEKLTGPEDWDLDKKLKKIGEIALVSHPIYHNEAEFDLMKYLSKKGYYGEKFDEYIKKWGKDDPDIKKQFGLSYRFFGVFMENGKWKKLLAHPCLAFGMYFLRGMVGFNFLLRKKS